MKSKRELQKLIEELKEIRDRDRSGLRVILPDNQRLYQGSAIGTHGKITILPPNHKRFRGGI